MCQAGIFVCIRIRCKKYFYYLCASVWIQTITPVIVPFQTKAYIKYILNAGHLKGFGIHSPYVFALLNDVIYERNAYYCYDDIKSTGAKTPHIAFPCTTTKKYTQLLHRLAVYSKAETIIELGSNTGMSALYLASVSTHASVYTIEPVARVAEMTGYNIARYNRRNINLIQGTFDKNLSSLLENVASVDILHIAAAFTDEKASEILRLAAPKTTADTIYIMAAPHSTEETEMVWHDIQEAPDVTLSLDLFHMGLAFFKPDIPKQHYTIKF